MRIKFLLIALFISTACFGQDYSNYNVENIPITLKNRANAVIRNMESAIDMRAPENVIFSVRKVVTVLNKNGNQRAALGLYYNKNTIIKGVKGLILNQAGMAIGKFNLTNFTDESAVSDFSLFEDDRIKHYTPSVDSYPYTVVYEYEMRFKQNLNLPEWYANPYPDVAVEQSNYTFTCKPGDKIRIKEYNFKGSPEVTKTDKFESYKWTVNKLNAFKSEPFAPDPDSYLTYVKVAAEKFSYYGHQGSYENWKQLGKWVYDDLIKSRQELPAETIKMVSELVKNATNDKGKARLIYDYLQKKTRYISVQVGIGGFQPFAASEVDKLSYGDCKALVNYAQTLLKAVNIESYYCVVFAGNLKKSIDPEFASMDQGNHIILCLPFEKDTTWLECTSQDSPFGFLGTFTDDRFVLACTPEGGKVLKTPALQTVKNVLKREAELTLATDGSLKGNITTVFSGSQYDNYDRLINKPYSDQLKLLKEEYDIDNIDFTDLKLVQKKEINPATVENVNVTIPKYASVNNKHVYLTLNAFNKAQLIPEVRNRTLPVYINRGYTDVDVLTYNLPEGYEIDLRPKDVTVKSPFGTFTLTVELRDRKLTYTRMLSLNNGTFPAEDYEKFANFFNTVSSNDQGKIVFKVN
jgi:transglutaminase-like putative cysteine protease